MNALVLYGTHEAPAIQDIYFNNPFKVLEKKSNFHFNLVELSEFSWGEIYEYNLIIISRIFQPEILDLIEVCKKANKDVLFFFDDDILNFPMEYYLNHEPFYKKNEQLIIEILKRASGLVVSTEKLKATYQKYNDTIHVTPPCLNIGLIEQNKTEKEPGKFTIGYAGSFGHVIDFRFMEKALLDFYRKHASHICIEFMGCIPEAFGNIINHDSIKLIHWQPDYERYLKNILRASWDIALCPVMDSAYTSHKTNIKFLEYSASNIPGIFSDISIYAKDIVDSFNGFLARNDYESWLEKMEYAYANRSLLPGIGCAAHEFVIRQYSDAKSAEIWSDILLQYEKEGLAKISEEISIKVHKTKKIYSSNGMAGLAKKLTKLYSPQVIPYKIKQLSEGLSVTTKDIEAEMVFKKVTKNFDRDVIKKQVLFIIPWLSVGGGDMVNLTIAKSLDREKYTLHFITTEISRHEWERKFRKVSRNIFHVRKVIENAKYFWEYNNLILEYIERAKIDTIIISNSAIGYTCLPAIKERYPHIKVLDILHGQGGSKEGGGFPEFSNPYDAYIDTRITINQYLKRYMVDRYGIDSDKIEVIHNCIDTQKFNRKKGSSENTLTVTYVGRLSYEKHPEHIIDIAEKVLMNLPGAKIYFRIIGDGPLYKELARLIDRKNLTKHVFLKGYKDNIKKQLEKTDVLLLCSEMEGLPIVLLEAMSMSVPCIASNVGGIPELINDGSNGFLIDYDAEMIDGFSNRIQQLYLDKSLRVFMGKKARNKIVDHFSMSNLKAYASLIN